MDYVQCTSSCFDPTDPLHRQTERFYWLSQPFAYDRSISENRYTACMAI